jgi:hypothetical protein
MDEDSLEISLLDTSVDVESFGETHKKAAHIFAYLLHQENVEPSQRPVFMNIVRDKDLPMVNMTKQFAHHLINHMGEREREQLERIQKEDKSEYGIENEELTDFVEMELVDAATSYRKWEHGKYALRYFMDGLHSPESTSAIDSKNIDHKILLEKFSANLTNGEQQWEPFVHLFLIQAFKYRLNPSSTNIAAYDLIGDLVQKNLVYLSIKMNPLKSTFKESLSLAMTRGRRRGPKR